MDNGTRSEREKMNSFHVTKDNIMISLTFLQNAFKLYSC
jgi:hypothetical protein